ncbi:MAG: PAS domain S-box protein [Myxococcales bacterium]|nr:PAS domain S-box protein [Myxococcales bacterium]
MKPISQAKEERQDEDSTPESSLPASQILDRFRRLCEVLPLAVLETDVDENLLYQNPRWEEISGQDEEASKDQGWRDAIHAEDREWVLEEATLARGQNRMFDADFRISRPDERERWVHGRSLPLYSGPGWHDGYLHMIYDITDRKLIEETLRDSLAELTIKRATENGEVAATATQVKESLVEAQELVQSLREANPADASLELIDRLYKCLEAAASASEALPVADDGEIEDPSLADILF